MCNIGACYCEKYLEKKLHYLKKSYYYCENPTEQRSVALFHFKSIIMSKNGKIFLGVLTFLPIISLLMTIGFMVNAFSIVQTNGAPDAEALSDSFRGLLILTVIGIFLSIGLLIYYIIHAVNNKKLTDNERVIWVILFIFISNIAFIIYWILRIWQDKSDTNMLSTNRTLDDDFV